MVMSVVSPVCYAVPCTGGHSHLTRRGTERITINSFAMVT